MNGRHSETKSDANGDRAKLRDRELERRCCCVRMHGISCCEGL